MCSCTRQRLETRMQRRLWDENSRCQDCGSHRGLNPTSQRRAFFYTFNCSELKAEVSLRAKIISQ